MLVGRVGGHARGNLRRDALGNAILVAPGDIAEQVVEALEDVGQVVQLGVGLPPSPIGGHGADLGILVGQRERHGRPLLDPVAVHVDRFQHALGRVLLDGRRSLGTRNSSGMDSFSHAAFV